MVEFNQQSCKAFLNGKELEIIRKEKDSYKEENEKALTLVCIFKEVSLSKKL